MTPVEALHTAARRYCIEQVGFWSGRYRELCARGADRVASRGGAWDYSPAAYDLFPRYNVLGAIRVEVERLVPAELGLLENARVAIAMAGEMASNAVTRGDNPIERAAMQQEREKFVAFVRGLTAAELEHVEPLPFRRVLGPPETKRLAEQVVQRWGTWSGGVSDKLDIPEHLILQLSRVDARRVGDLRAMLRERRVERPFELREFDESYEIDLDAVDFAYDGREATWCEPGARWMINASHEDSLALGGGWLVAAVQARWPDWAELRYRGFDGEFVPVERAP